MQFFCSFHVGSGTQSADSYAQALASVKQVFITAVSLIFVDWNKNEFILQEQLDFKMELLDIGGGFPGSLHLDTLFQEVWWSSRYESLMI